MNINQEENIWTMKTYNLNENNNTSTITSSKWNDRPKSKKMFDLTILELSEQVQDDDSPIAKEIFKHLASIYALYKELENEN